ncbi:MAG: hypothetical protein JSV65_13595, partial [Armatimonadota bacterium]
MRYSQLRWVGAAAVTWAVPRRAGLSVAFCAPRSNSDRVTNDRLTEFRHLAEVHGYGAPFALAQDGE